MADMHTPLPWDYDADSGEVFFEDGNICPVIAFVNFDSVSDEQAYLDGVAIVTAVNERPALLETIKALEAQIATKDTALKVALAWSDADWVGHEIVVAALAGSAS